MDYAATPKHLPGALVNYLDRHDRPQTGEILSVEAHWRGKKPTPLIIYRVEHPSYHNGQCYITYDRFLGARP